MGRYDQNKGKRNSRYQSGTEEQSAQNGISIFIIIVLMLLAGIGGYLARPQVEKLANNIKPIVKPLAIPANSEKLQPPPSTNTEQANNIQTLPAVEDWFVLPELDNSDGPLREAITQAAPSLLPFLQTDRLIKTYLTIASDFSQGQRLAKHLNFLKHEQPFTTATTANQLIIAEDSFRRYDIWVQAISTVDSQSLLVVYKKFRPLLVKVVNELGYSSDISPEDLLTKAALQILSAPIIDRPLALTPHAERYKFANPELEALNPVYKQMLRMGAKNTRLVQEKMRVLVEGLANIEE